MVESRSLAVLAISRVQPSQLPLCEAAPGALGTSALVVEHAHTAANLPFAGIAFCADVDDDAGWLVRGDYGQLGPELAIEDLDIGVTEPSRVNFDEELVISNLGDVLLRQDVCLLILKSR